MVCRCMYCTNKELFDILLCFFLQIQRYHEHFIVPVEIYLGCDRGVPLLARSVHVS